MHIRTLRPTLRNFGRALDPRLAAFFVFTIVVGTIYPHVASAAIGPDIALRASKAVYVLGGAALVVNLFQAWYNSKPVD